MKFGRAFFSQNIFSKNSAYVEKNNEHLFFTGPLVELQNKTCFFMLGS